MLFLVLVLVHELPQFPLELRVLRNPEHKRKEFRTNSGGKVCNSEHLQTQQVGNAAWLTCTA